MSTLPVVVPASSFVLANTKISADSSQRIARLAILVEEPLPLVNIIPKSLAGDAVVPCASLISGSVTVRLVVLICV